MLSGCLNRNFLNFHNQLIDYVNYAN